MKILSFDPGVNLGYAITLLSDTGPPFEIKHLSSDVIRYDSDLPITLRLIALKDSLKDLVEATRPDIICVEAVNRVFGGAKGANADALYRIYGYVHEIAFDKNIIIVDLPITTVKSSFTGNGKSDKKAMMKAATAFAGRPITENNEADAIGIGKTFADLFSEAMTESEDAKYTSDFRRDFSAFAKDLYQRRNNQTRISQ